MSHQVHGGGARWVWLYQQLGGDLTTELDLSLDHLKAKTIRGYVKIAKKL